MPPVRTANNHSLRSSNSRRHSPEESWLKSIPKGAAHALFRSSERDWASKYEKEIGTATRRITFGSEFVLTDDHIDDIIALGSPICKKIWYFTFAFEDVSYGAKNDAKALTNDAVVRLSKSCPSLKTVQLQGTAHVTDDGLLGLFQNCPNLTSVEVTYVTRNHTGGLTGRALDELREHPEWAPKLKKLILGESEHNKVFMKAMRALTRERTGLTVTLVSRSERKRWGDWELEETRESYKKGRVARAREWCPGGGYAYGI